MMKPNSSFPVFVVENLNLAKSFYCDYFSFSPAFENDWYLHLVSDSGIQIGFLLPEQQTQPSILHERHSGKGVIFSLEVDDAESAYAEVVENALDVVLELRAEDWGQYHFCIRDPNGVLLDVVQSTEPTEEYQQGYEAK